MTNIENLKDTVDEIRKGLENLKNNISFISETEKLEKVKEIKTKIDTTIDDIQSTIDSLSKKTDDLSKKTKEEAEALLNYIKELMSLYASIIGEKVNAGFSKATGQAKKWYNNLFDWVGEQWDAITVENLKNEPGKTLFRGTCFAVTGVGALVGVGALAYTSIKGIWNWIFPKDKKKTPKTKKEEKSETDNKTESETDNESESDNKPEPETEEKKEEEPSLLKRVANLIVDLIEEKK